MHEISKNVLLTNTCTIKREYDNFMTSKIRGKNSEKKSENSANKCPIKTPLQSNQVFAQLPTKSVDNYVGNIKKKREKP